VTALKKNIKELETVDLDDLINEVETHAVEIEDKLLKMISEQNHDENMKIPYLTSNCFELNVTMKIIEGKLTRHMG